MWRNEKYSFNWESFQTLGKVKGWGQGLGSGVRVKVIREWTSTRKVVLRLSLDDRMLLVTQERPESPGTDQNKQGLLNSVLVPYYDWDDSVNIEHIHMYLYTVNTNLNVYAWCDSTHLISLVSYWSRETSLSFHPLQNETTRHFGASRVTNKQTCRTTACMLHNLQTIPT